MMKYRLGIDIGSTTVKAVLLDDHDQIQFHCYRRHRSDVRGEMAALFRDIASELADVSAAVCLTGSAGLGAAAALRLPFSQEVMAGTAAVNRFIPGTDVVIELGGEDAKITFMKPVVSQRMNGTCAGGTGAFIDQMAALLQTDAGGLNELAKYSTSLYTIASRCGVFAKSDLQPLLNEGVSHPDLAASVLQAVVNQTIAGLACGQPIHGNVVFLGGPLTYLSELRGAFERTLADKAVCVMPEHAEVFVAVGAALLADDEPMALNELPMRLEEAGEFDADIPRLAPLFENDAQRQAFLADHASDSAPRADISLAEGPCFLGLDAGSTTIKAVLLDKAGRILYTYYASNQGNPLLKSVDILTEMYAQLPPTAHIGGTWITGYGEALLRTALRADGGEIETLCHARAAAAFAPDVTFILDIGGQDMKCMKIKDGVLDSVLLNEACSSGCGSFIQAFAESLGLDVVTFAQKALESESPVDLGTRCTVFMNSRVKQAQKEGATVGDISCGLSYSVIRNALYKVIKLKNAAEMGQTILVQGGTFLNDAVLRCFELITDRRPIRPDIAGLMGAYGAALLAREHAPEDAVSRLLPADRLTEALPETTRAAVCQGCTNHCKLTISTFSGGRRLVSGHRCEKGEGKKAAAGALPNLVEEKYAMLFDFPSLSEAEASRGVIGIPRALNLYENYPLWHVLLTKLGFSVRLSRPSDHVLFEEGMATIPSESVCYPAKLAHGHVHDLLGQGVTRIFYPCVAYERQENVNANNHFNCPIVQSYPEVLDANVDGLTGARFLKPFLSLAHPRKMVDTLVETFADWNISRGDMKSALDAGFAAMDDVKRRLRERGDEVILQLEREDKQGIVLAGRPYHVDPEIHHGLPGMINALGFAVLTEDCVAHRARVERPLRVFDQWVYHTRLYDAAAVVAENPHLQMVQLNSFGCGLDAVTTDQVQEILQAAGKIYTVLKIDEINSLGAARIRMRSLAAALEQRKKADATPKAAEPYAYHRQEFTPEMKKAHTILGPQMSPVHFTLIEAVLRSDGYNVVILQHASPEDIETGLRFVNNDACFPTIVVVGQLMNAMLSGKYDPDNTSIFLTQTGGGCRATNYVALLRRALREAGFAQVPVVALSVSSIEKNSGVKWTIPLIDKALKAIVLGDLLQQVLLRTRPYESAEGAATALYRRWLDTCADSFSGKGAKRKFADLIEGILHDFEELELRDIPRKPRVGLVGEILVKFHPDANNNAVGVIEAEQCEAVVPGLLGFFQYCFLNSVIKHEVLGASGVSAMLMEFALKVVDRYQNAVKQRMKRSTRFHTEASIHELAEKAEQVLSTANQCGEGWLLTAEMLELIESGVPNIICAQPFACLPNHVTGKGMIRKLRTLYPEANIVPIDYDPGASEVNQLNRIKLMISAALQRKPEAAKEPAGR